MLDDTSTAATTEAPAPAPVTGYRLILPAEWAQVPLRHGTEAAVRRILGEAAGRLPVDAPAARIGPYRREWERRFRAAVVEARRSGALDLYLPVRPVGDFTVGASIVVSESLLPRPPGAPATGRGAADVVARLLATGGAREVELSSGTVDGAPAVRREHVVGVSVDAGAGAGVSVAAGVGAGDEVGAEAGAGRGAALSSRRVEYLVPVPGDPDRWFLAAFSTVGGGSARDELAEALVEWFDAVMATFRWSRE